MEVDVMSLGAAERKWVPSPSWTGGWRRFVAPTGFLVYLVYTGSSVAKHSHGATAVIGYVVLVAFAACYLAVIGGGLDAAASRFWRLYGLLVALLLVELPFAHDAAFVMCLYIAAITVGRLGLRAVPLVVLMAASSLLVPVAVPSWHESLASTWGSVTPVAIVVVAILSFAVARIFERNLALAEARAELASLAAENERLRIARDLHDLLGHSLTTITVKAGLACRLGEADPARSVREMAEVEALARRSLNDVRAAVANYRQVTLGGELATGRELLRAASITAELPRAVDLSDPAREELFGWVVREGLTNVVRHSHASSCSIRLSTSSVEILDDGVGQPSEAGSGLAGLRERIAAAGGLFEAGPRQPRGWRLRVSVPAPADDR